MENTMTPSTESEPKITTDGQIDKAVANFRALLEKHSPEFDSEAVQSVLGQSKFVDNVFAMFRQDVEAISHIITRFVKVNRARNPQEAIKATGRIQHVDSEVVNAMPRGQGDEAKVDFFKLDLSERGGYISDDDLEKEYELRGRVPVDPYSLAAVNEADPSFADTYPNVTHWKDANGKWCYLAFDRWSAERHVFVDRYDDDWFDDWWFAARRK